VKRKASSDRFFRFAALAMVWGLVGPALFVRASFAAGSAAESISFTAGAFRVTIGREAQGLAVLSLYDAAWKTELAAAGRRPLFGLTLRRIGAKDEKRLAADAGWGSTSIRRTRGGFELQWSDPKDEGLAGLKVTAAATAEASANAWHWKISVRNATSDWSVWRVVFPQVTIADLGEGSAVFIPRGPGEVQRGVGQRSFVYHGDYPGAWCAMPFLAAYREGENPVGLYMAVHDGWGSTKSLGLESDPAAHVVSLSIDHPAPDMGKAGNDFDLSGEAVWRLLRGDWFDAAQIYRDWASREARWWPRLSQDGRSDTPLWMRDLNVWAQTGGSPEECVGPVKDFQKFLGLPVGFHWYNWHQIPFDNDYPHYFPTKPGFPEGVAELQKNGVFVMPYINGRLWDVHDRGAEDFEFSRLALPAATKGEDGRPSVETYGSKESDGSPVQLAAMCPTTVLWQKTVRDLVLKLTRETGTAAVYIDQIAAAAPILCMDPAHGHPLGGGHWWTEGYWRMLESIRAVLPRNAALTTECNGEPYIRWFDGYLTWHWQYDGQVPAFPAVYGGAIQMFGRAYRQGDSKDLALRMKAGQQLVFGEQLGWIDPALVKEKENAEFFRGLALLRDRLRRYFSAGRMARPPKSSAAIPTVRADWQWSGVWPVTADAVLTGAWRLPEEKKLVLLYVNVSDQSVSFKQFFDAQAYGLPAGGFSVRKLTAEPGQTAVEIWPAVFEREATFPPRRAQAWELTWQP
jgi:hypothetical protein